MQELLLMDNAAVLSRRLVSSGHLATLRLFRRRTLFANTQNDLVVGFATSSLLFDDAQGDKVCVFGATPRALPCTAAAFSDDRSAWSTVVHLPRLHDSETAAALSHTIRDLRQGGWGEEQAQKKELASPTHLSPHAIAAALRQELDWRVVALRYTSVWPVAHLECLGMLRQYSAAPEMVQRVAQEVLELH
ncbi:hypothetical protein DQ04_04581010 [Trypanosoma grayi]|uniref:hypothetical protein n=1 Tax=Trypanosoma grayi TaxID=71804 RepID=UPI0004F455CA|nr:hypothetical protein DQ04_04581010 [Trypanosoma grayi]KEG09819.1 hypothetical protein DQ04_04581010 [Trypanosoma grayi]